MILSEITYEVSELDSKLKEVLGSNEILWLSEKTGIHRNTITSYINGSRLPRIDNAYKVASALGKSVYEIWPPD
jgi:plasmid maintenance system antidote protein VapI